jgi:hypothetical protein
MFPFGRLRLEVRMSGTPRSPALEPAAPDESFGPPGRRP